MSGPKDPPTAQFMIGLLQENFHKLSVKQLLALELATRDELARRGLKSRTSGDRGYIETAHDLHHKDGEVEVDTEDAYVSRGSDPGAYVQAWVWVYDSDVKAFRKRQRKEKRANHGTRPESSRADPGSD